jgi:hypothetical protein
MTDTVHFEVISSVGEGWALFADGARVSWQNDMVCTCITAKKQRPSHNMCKHIVEVIRQRKDLILGNRGIFLAVALGVKATDTISWVSIKPDPDNKTLWAALADHGLTFVAHTPEPICRLDARSLVIPHLLGYVHQVKCTKCLEERRASLPEFAYKATAEPIAVMQLLRDRENPVALTEAIREVCHWMDDPTINLCRLHDDSDLVPF